MRLICVPLLFPIACAAAPQVLLTSTAESELVAKVTPPAGVVRLILQGEPDDAGQFHQCVAEQGGVRSRFFAASVIDLNGDGLPDYFVRPALEPYCGVFYGAHLFRYWFVTSHRKGGRVSYRLAFKSGGDEVSVLRARTKGYRDLELVGHTAFEAHISTWRFNGKSYEASACKARELQPDGTGRISSC